jgi:hypothetical protein
LGQHIGVGIGSQAGSALLPFDLDLSGSLARRLDDSLIVEAIIELGLSLL